MVEDLRPFKEVDNLPLCEACDCTTERIYGIKRALGALSAKATHDGSFDIVLEHVNVEGEGDLRFTSRKQLKDHCRKHKISSGALL